MQLHYTVKGTGPALIILHGLYGQGDNWLNIANELVDKFTVYLIDQRNHGRSPHSPFHSYEDLSHDIRGFCNEHEIRDCYLLGHSMGGKTAMTFTLQYPGIVKKLVVVDISPFSYLDQQGFSGQIAFHQRILETFKKTPLIGQSDRAGIEEKFARGIPNPEIRKFLLKNLRRNPDGSFFWQLNTGAITSSLNQIIDTIPPVKTGTRSHIPVLFIKGGISPYIATDDMQAIPDVFPNAVFKTIENTGHWVHAEEPSQFILLVREFLAD